MRNHAPYGTLVATGGGPPGSLLATVSHRLIGLSIGPVGNKAGQIKNNIPSEMTLGQGKSTGELRWKFENFLPKKVFF